MIDGAFAGAGRGVCLVCGGGVFAGGRVLPVGVEGVLGAVPLRCVFFVDWR